MIRVADALNSFASEPEATAPPSEEIFVLTFNQLEAIIAQAIERAVVPLEARIQNLEQEGRGLGCQEGGEVSQNGQDGLNEIFKIVLSLQEENMGLKRELEAFQEYSARERAFDRQRIAKLEHVEPQPLQKDRGDILRALIAANGGKMLAKEARKKMRLSKSRFSELLVTMKEEIEARPYHLNKNWKVISLK